MLYRGIDFDRLGDDELIFLFNNSALIIDGEVTLPARVNPQ